MRVGPRHNTKLGSSNHFRPSMEEGKLVLKMTSRKKSKLDLSYCILSENTVVSKAMYDRLIDHGMNKLTLLKGSLVHVESKISDEIYTIKVLRFAGSTYDEDIERHKWLCGADRLLPVNEILWPLLEAVSSPIDKVRILKDKSLRNELCSIEVGSMVEVLCTGGNTLRAPETAVVRYKGPISKRGHGTYFGVELLVRLSY